MIIGKIIWDEQPTQATRSYIAFQLKVLDEFEINLPMVPNNASAIRKKWLEGQVTLQEIFFARDEWWDVIDKRGWLQEFRLREALLARLSLCLLVVDENDANQLNDHLSWFLEVLDFLCADTQRAISLMKQEFRFN